MRAARQAFIVKALTGSGASVSRSLLSSAPASSVARGSGTMDAVPPLIQLSVALRVQPNEAPVFFKVDGSRFGQSRTIKLLTGSKYKVEVVARPGAVEAT